MTKIEIVKQILASDIIGWVLAFIGGFLVFKIVDNMQTAIERHNVIRDVESSLNAIFSQPIAKSNKCSTMENNEEINCVTVRTVLHDNSPWEEYIKDKTEILIENNQRYVQIRKEEGYKEYISTQAIHELLILFRRIEKLYKDSILKPIDLADMWREILPFGTSGRLNFYKSYLGESDMKSIIFVLFNTLLACKKYKIDNAVEGFAKDFFNNKAMQKFYYKNSRYTFKEKVKIKKFFSIIKKIGEKPVSIFLSQLDEPKYKVINYIRLQVGNKTTQIDHVVISNYGIFVIETKNYKGWIIGNEYDDNWEQVIYKRNEKLHNPIKQNYDNIQALKEVLNDVLEINYISIVAFTTKADLKVTSKTDVVHGINLPKTIKKYNNETITDSMKEQIYAKLISLNIDRKYNRRAHAEAIYSNFIEKNNKLNNYICPKCGGTLVERNGKYGQVKGCSNYQKCRYILK